MWEWRRNEDGEDDGIGHEMMEVEEGLEDYEDRNEDCGKYRGRTRDET